MNTSYSETQKLLPLAPLVCIDIIWPVKLTRQSRKQKCGLRSYLVAVTLPVPACGFMPPQFETHDGSDQVHHHGDKQKDEGGCLTCLCPAEGSVDAIVENRVEAEATAGGILNINDTWCTKAVTNDLNANLKLEQPSEVS